MIPLFLIFCVLCFFSLLNPALNDFGPVITLFIVFISVSSYYFYEKLKLVSRYPIHKTISFWLCIGLFLYFSGNLFYLLFANSYSSKDNISHLRILNTAITILKNLILSLAWLGFEYIEKESDIITTPQHLGLDDDIPYLTKTTN